MQQVLVPHIIEYYADNDTNTYTSTAPCNGLNIANDGASSLTVAINGLTITVKSNEVFEGKFNAFTSVTITATDNYRCCLLSYGY